MAAGDAKPFPLKNTAYRVYFSILDADGDLVTGAAGLDSECSLDGATFADCTNEATEIATSSGMYYLDLIAAEMNTDCTVVIVKTSTAGAKTTPIILYPVEDTDIRVNVINIEGVDATDQIGDAVADEVLTGETHNITNSLGRKIREIGAFAIHSGTAQAGTSHSITLAATADANDGVYNRNLIVLVDNTGAGQTRTIVDYDGSTKIAVIDRDFRVSPDATTTYQITPADTALVVDQGIAQAGTSTTITLRSYASAVDNNYLCNIIVIIAGTGRGQARLVGSYDGGTKVVTVCGDNWVTTPDATSVYAMMPYGTACTSCVGNTAQAEIVAAMIAGIADGSYDLQEMVRIMFSALSGKSSGGGTSTLTFRDVADSKNRISETVDETGNRTAVTRDGS